MYASIESWTWSEEITLNKGCTMYTSIDFYLEHGSEEMTCNKGCTMYTSIDLLLEHGSEEMT